MRDSLTNSAYPWGDSIAATQANYNANVGLPTAAGTYPPTLHYGLYDIAGNVWEWCGDWYVSTLTGPVTNPVGPAAGLTKSLRGGSWVNPASRLRCATRYQMDPFARYADLGFRCAASPAALTAPFVGGAAGGVPEWWKQYYFGVAANGFDANRDTDGDGLTDGQEYAAGTDPTRADSCLKILTIRPSGAGVGVTWEGGATATQYLEVLRDVAGTGATWSALFTNLPPTATVTNFTDTGSGGAVRLYRIRATR